MKVNIITCITKIERERSWKVSHCHDNPIQVDEFKVLIVKLKDLIHNSLLIVVTSTFHNCSALTDNECLIKVCLIQIRCKSRFKFLLN